MSRIGKKPVELPSGVTASLSGQTIEVKGAKGTRTFTATDDVTFTIEENAVKISPRGSSKRARQQWGMSRTMVQNLVTSVTDGFTSASRGPDNESPSRATKAAAFTTTGTPG